jgi:hypothetical protein
MWMRSGRVVRASDSQCRSRICPGVRSQRPPTQQMKQCWLLQIKKKNPKKSPFKKSILMVVTAAAELIKANIRQFLSILSKSISWDSPFKSCVCWQEVVGSSGVMGTLSWLSVSGTNMVELEDRDLSLCPNLLSLNLRHHTVELFLWQEQKVR